MAVGSIDIPTHFEGLKCQVLYKYGKEGFLEVVDKVYTVYRTKPS